MSKKILVVEDEEDMLSVMDLRLTSTGYEVVLAENCREALERFRESIPDLVMLDIMLPDGNGFDLCKKMKQESSQRAKIIMFTNKVEAIDVTRARQSGADDFIVKTSDLVFILEAIKRVLKD
ncbi:MAG: response regulator [Candidatus Omnitrophota bacterium]|jgi:DNA-binding response OmpR family regulator